MIIPLTRNPNGQPCGVGLIFFAGQEVNALNTKARAHLPELIVVLVKILFI